VARSACFQYDRQSPSSVYSALPVKTIASSLLTLGLFTLALGVNLVDVLRDRTTPTVLEGRILADRVGRLVLTTGMTAIKSATETMFIAADVPRIPSSGQYSPSDDSGLGALGAGEGPVDTLEILGGRPLPLLTGVGARGVAMTDLDLEMVIMDG
jgi:hypothetical protein